LRSELVYSMKKIGSGAIVFSGYAFKSKDLGSYGIPVVKIKNVNNRIVTLSNVEYFPNEKVTEKLRKFFLENGDLLIAMTGQGSVGRVGKLRLSSNQKVLLNQRVGKFIIESDSLDKEFLYQIISSPYYEQILFDAGNGSGQPNLSPDAILDVEIPFPDIFIQRKIAKILSSLDDKVWFLQRQNEILEKIIQSIFKSWFIDFDGQTEFVDSELGEIPKGWEVCSLKEVLSLLKDGSHNPPQRVKEGIKFIAGASDLKHFEIDFTNCTYITKEEYEKIHKYWEIKSDDILLTIVGTVGNIGIVKEFDLPFSLQRSIAVLRPNDKIDFVFLYCLLNTIEFEQFLYANINPTGQPGIYLGTLSEFKIVLPSQELIKSFSKISKPIISLIQKNYENIRMLKNIRDYLLPKLMSGEIRV